MGANVGILAGLILVGLQMRQNEQLLRTQMAYEESNRYSQIEAAMLGEEPSIVWAKSLVDPASPGARLSIADMTPSLVSGWLPRSRESFHRKSRSEATTMIVVELGPGSAAA